MVRRNGPSAFGCASLRCARAVAVFILLAGVALNVRALPVHVCDAGTLGDVECAGDVVVLDESAIGSGSVWACLGAVSELAGYPTWWCDGERGWALPASMGSGDYMEYSGTGDSGVWLAKSFFPAFGSGGGGGGEDWTLEDLDLAEAAQGFSVAFMIVALFWGLGKGVGVIIHAVKRF